MRILDKILKRMIVKASRLFPHLYQRWEEDAGVAGDADAENYARTYSAATWVYVCVTKISRTSSSVPLKFYRQSKEETDKVEEGELVELFSKVNPFISFSDLIEATAAYLLLNGNAYWAIEGNGRKEIYPLRADRVKIVPDPKEFVKGYVYNVKGKSISFDRDEVIHFKFFNAESEYYGLSPLAVARMVLTLEFYALTSNKNLFKNAVRPGGVLEVEHPLDDTTYRRLKRQWEKAHKGPDNWHKMIVLEGGAKWRDTAIRPKDMEFLAQRKMNREEICAIFGVPPAEVGIFEYANYANSREQRKIFWEDTIIPILKRIAGTINEKLVPSFGPNLFCDFDFSGVAALKEDEREKMEVATGLVGRNIITVNEARGRFYNLPAVDWGDRPQPQTPQFGLSISAPPKPAIEPAWVKMIDNGGKKIDHTDEEYAFWKRFDTALLRHQNEFNRRIKEFLEQQKKRILQNIENLQGKTLGLKLSEEELDMIFDTLKENGLLEEMTRTEFRRMIEEIGTRAAAELGVDFAFNPLTPRIEAWMRNKILQMVQSVNMTTRRQIADILVRGLEEGYTAHELSGRIADHLDRIKDYRSDRIARTEVIGVNNKAVWEAYKQSGAVKKKQWIATLDERVRDTHEAAHRQVRGIDEYFLVGDSLLMFPGDVGGSPEEVINCRCTIKAIKN